MAYSKFKIPFSEDNNRLIEKVTTVPGYVIGSKFRKYSKTIHPDCISRYAKVGRNRTKKALGFEPNSDTCVYDMNVIEGKGYYDSPFYDKMGVCSRNQLTSQLKHKPRKLRSRLKVSPLDGQFNTMFSRLESFKHWSLNSSVSAILLVNAGFFCVDASTEKCECLSCGLTIVCTELEGMSPLDVHKAKSPACDFIQMLRHDRQIPATRHPTTSHDVADAHTRDLYPHNSNHSSNSHDPRETDNTTASRSHTDAMHDSQNKRSTTDSTPGCLQNGFSQPPPKEQPAQSDAKMSYPARNPTKSTDQQRRETFMYWPHQSMLDIDGLVDAGFFFTGTEDIVRCFQCDIGLAEWNADDDPWIEHARHSPDCPYLTRKKSRSFIDQVQQAWAKIYTPKRPELAQLESRLKTFQNSSWPSDQVWQTPRQIAEAGFYYIGDGDTVRCHYCDGGLREWEPNDDPWVEHARWFPFCKYVLKVKGIQFIQNAACGNETNTQSASASASVPASVPPLPSAYNAEGQKMSYEDECRKKEQANLLLTAAAQSIKEMGYNRNVIKYAINEYIGRTGRRNFNATDLMEIICDKEDSGEPWLDDENGQLQATGCQSDEGSSDEEIVLSTKALKKENEYLLTKFKCIKCKTKDRCMLFLPCGHRTTCEACSRTITECNNCGSIVEKSLKTYLA